MAVAARVRRWRRRRARWARSEIVERNHTAGLAVNHLRFGRGGEPIVHRAALVGFDMTEADPAQALDRQDARGRL